MNKIFFTISAMLTVSAALYGNILKVTTLEGNKPNAMTESAEFIKINPECGYKFSGKLIGNDGGKAAVGLSFYDIAKRKIYPSQVNAVVNTETELLKAVKKGDTAFIVKDASKWRKPASAPIVAFNVKKDCSDLPNSNVLYYIKSIKKVDNGYEITMSRPVQRAYAAGVLVRQHHDGGWNNLGIAPQNITPTGTTLKGEAKRALNSGLWNRVWPGAAYAKIYIIPTAKVKLQDLILEEVDKNIALALDENRILEGNILKNSVRTFGTQKTVKIADGLQIATQKGRCGFYQMGLNWNTENITQIEFTVKATQPGYLSFGYVTKKDGKGVKGISGLKPIQIMPDGKWHTIIFPVAKGTKWQGIMTNYELVWSGNEGTLALQKISAVKVENAIPDATAFIQKKNTFINNLFPRTKCVLRWLGSEIPEVELAGYDRNLTKLDWSVKIDKNSPSVEFVIPENLVRAELKLKSAAVSGMPQLQITEDYRRPFAPSSGWRGQWLWHQCEWGPFHASVWFEKNFELTGKPDFAVAVVMADDESYTFINGEYVGETRDFQAPRRFNIAKYLKKGKNNIKIRVFNGMQNAGLVYNSFIRCNGKEIFIDSDKSWKCDSESNLESRFPQKIDKNVVELGDPDFTLPWAAMIPFKYAGRVGILNVKSFEENKIIAEVESLPAEVIRQLNFTLTAPDGRKRIVALPVSPDSRSWKKGGTLELKFPTPRWEKNSFVLSVSDEYVALKGTETAVNTAEKVYPATQIKKASLLNSGKRVVLDFGGKKYNPVYFNIGRAVGRNNWHEIDFAAQSGVKNFRIPANFLDFWKGENQYDFSRFDAVMDTLLSHVPDAIAAIQLTVHMPDWWLAANPDHESKHFNGSPRMKQYDKQAMGSKKWLKDAEAPIRALIKHVQSCSYADRIWGMTVNENGNGEWFHWITNAKGKLSYNGFSVSDYETFRNQLREKYKTDANLAKAWKQLDVTFATAKMPDPALMNKGSIGTMLDPEKDAQLIDWYIFRNRIFGEALTHFGKVIKDATDNKWLVGAYYGYFNDLSANSYWRLQVVGHNAYLEVAKSPYIDFVHGPSRYTYRKVGMSDALMQIANTFTTYGKTVFCEQDTRTFYGRPESDSMKIYVGTSDSGHTSIGQMHRGFGMALATGTAYYYYDITTSALYEKITIDAIRDQVEAYKNLPPLKNHIPVEVAIIGDRDSAYMVKAAGEDGIFTAAVTGLFQRFNELAVPYHNYSFDDLLRAEAKVPAHKLYIMLPTIVMSKAQRNAFLKRMEREKAAVVYLHNIGSNYPGKSPKAENCGDFIGLKVQMVDKMQIPTVKLASDYGNVSGTNYNKTSPWFYPVGGYDSVAGRDNDGKAVLVLKKKNGISHYFSTLANLPMEFYASLMKKHKIHRYCNKISDPVWVGNDVIFMHAKTGGEKFFNLPSGLKARAIIGPFKGTLTNGQKFNAEAGMTYGFVLEK